MVIPSDKALDHLGNSQQVLIPPIYWSRISQGFEVSLNVEASPSAWFSMCR